MVKKDTTSLVINKLNFIFVLLFCISLLKVCAQDKPSSPKKAQQSRYKFIEEVKLHLGSPYSFGAYGPDSFDCSGLVFYCAREALEYQLPRTARAIYNYVDLVPFENCEEGDLLFFKTTAADSVSHVGIYIGDNMFISALSDGPNAGVRVSSLDQPYWQEKLVGAGQFIAPVQVAKADTKQSNSSKPKEEKKQDIKKKKKSATTDTLKGLDEDEDYSYLYEDDDEDEDYLEEEKELSAFACWVRDNIVAEESIFYDWSFFAPEKVAFQYRGIDAITNVRYTGWYFEPGLSLGLCFNTGVQVFQLPILFNLSFNEYIRVFAGPVFNFGDAVLVGTERTVKPTVFPGMFGTEFSTPSLDIHGVIVQAVQNISYTVYNNRYGEIPTAKEEITSGLVFKTGIRVCLPMKLFLR